MEDLFQQAKEQQSNYLVKKGILHKVSVDQLGEPTLLMVVPTGLRRTVFEEAHSSILAGHFGSRKTLKKITNLFFWPQCSKDVTKWCRECEMCQRHNMGVKHRSPL